MQDFRNLEIWQIAHRVVLRMYEQTRSFPEDERYGMISQLRRCSASIAANIAEGTLRQSDADFRRFLHMALGSLGELDYFLILSADLGYIDENDHNEYLNELGVLRRKMLTLSARLRAT